MLVTFSCDAHENITMFGDVAQRLIKMMGHSGAIPSAISEEDVSEALAHLRRAIEEENQKIEQEASFQEEDEGEVEVSLAHRAWPLIELLQDAAKAQCKVMWKAE